MSVRLATPVAARRAADRRQRPRRSVEPRIRPPLPSGSLRGARPASTRRRPAASPRSSCTVATPEAMTSPVSTTKRSPSSTTHTSRIAMSSPSNSTDRPPPDTSSLRGAGSPSHSRAGRRTTSWRCSSIGPVWVASRSGCSGFGAGAADAGRGRLLGREVGVDHRLSLGGVGILRGCRRGVHRRGRAGGAIPAAAVVAAPGDERCKNNHDGDDGRGCAAADGPGSVRSCYVSPSVGHGGSLATCAVVVRGRSASPSPDAFLT